MIDKDKILQEFLKNPILQEKHFVSPQELADIKKTGDFTDHRVVQLLQGLVDVMASTYADNRKAGIFYAKIEDNFKQTPPQ